MQIYHEDAIMSRDLRDNLNYIYIHRGVKPFGKTGMWYGVMFDMTFSSRPVTRA